MHLEHITPLHTRVIPIRSGERVPEEAMEMFATGPQKLVHEVFHRFPLRGPDPAYVLPCYALRRPDGSLDYTKCDPRTTIDGVVWATRTPQRLLADPDWYEKREAEIRAEFDATINNELPPSSKQWDPVPLTEEQCHSTAEWQHFKPGRHDKHPKYGVVFKNYENQNVGGFGPAFPGTVIATAVDRRRYIGKYGKKFFDDYAVKVLDPRDPTKFIWVAPYGGGGTAQFLNGAPPGVQAHVSIECAIVKMTDPEGTQREHLVPFIFQDHEVPDGKQVLAAYRGDDDDYFESRTDLTRAPDEPGFDAEVKQEPMLDDDEAALDDIEMALPAEASPKTATFQTHAHDELETRPAPADPSAPLSATHALCLQRLTASYTNDGVRPLSAEQTLHLTSARGFMRQLQDAGYSIQNWAHQHAEDGAVPFQWRWGVPISVMRDTVEAATAGALTVAGRERDLTLQRNEDDIRAFDLWGKSKTTGAKQAHLRQVAAWLENEGQQGTQLLSEWVDVDKRTWEEVRLRDFLDFHHWRGTNIGATYVSVLSKFRGSVREEDDPVLSEIDQSPIYTRLLGRDEIDLQPWYAKIPSLGQVEDAKERALLIEMRIDLEKAIRTPKEEADARKFLGASRGFLQILREKHNTSLDEWVARNDPGGPDQDARRRYLQNLSRSMASYGTLLRHLIRLAIQRRDAPEVSRQAAARGLSQAPDTAQDGG